MKLNNKGFAITAVLYGLLILFVILVSSYLTVLSARKNRVDNLVKDIEDEYKENMHNITNDDNMEEDDGDDIVEDEGGDSGGNAVSKETIYNITLDLNYFPSSSTIIYYSSLGRWYSDVNNKTIITSITPPTRSGYTFEGYYQETSLPYKKVIETNGNIFDDFSFSSDTILKAHWSDNSHVSA